MNLNLLLNLDNSANDFVLSFALVEKFDCN